MSPHGEASRQWFATQHDEYAERDSAEQQPSPHHLCGRDPLERDLHEQEARSPDDPAQDELQSDRRL